SVVPRALPSFPTRRSSDLDDGDLFAGVDHGRKIADDRRVIRLGQAFDGGRQAMHDLVLFEPYVRVLARGWLDDDLFGLDAVDLRSEEHTSELQSRENLVCR